MTARVPLAPATSPLNGASNGHFAPDVKPPAPGKLAGGIGFCSVCKANGDNDAIEFVDGQWHFPCGHDHPNSGAIERDPTTSPLDGLAEHFATSISGYDASRAELAKPVVYVLDGAIASEDIVEFSGKSSSGKSTATFLLAVAVANPTGEPVEVFGRRVMPGVPGTQVLIINEENKRRSAIQQIDRAIEIFGFDPRATWDRIRVFARAGIRARHLGARTDKIRRPETYDTWAAIRLAAQRCAFSFIVLDTRAKVFAGFGDANAEDLQADVADEVTCLVNDAGCPLVIVSHVTKASDADEIEDVSGSAQRGGSADVIAMFKASKTDARVLSSTMRFVKLRDSLDGDAQPVRFELTKSDEGRWTMRTEVRDSKGESDAEPGHERVLALLHSEGAKTVTEIRDALKMSAATVQKHISTLFALKKISKGTARRKKGEVEVFRERTDTKDFFGSLGKGNEDE